MTIIPILHLRGYSRCSILIKVMQEGGSAKTFWFQMFALKDFKQKSRMNSRVDTHMSSKVGPTIMSN